MPKRPREKNLDLLWRILWTGSASPRPGPGRSSSIVHVRHALTRRRVAIAELAVARIA